MTVTLAQPSGLEALPGRRKLMEKFVIAALEARADELELHGRDAGAAA